MTKTLLLGQTLAFRADPFAVPWEEATTHERRGGVLLEGGLIAASAVFLFPLGWFLIVPLGAWSLAAARSLF